jgi:hypothetical protein
MKLLIVAPLWVKVNNSGQLYARLQTKAWESLQFIHPFLVHVVQCLAQLGLARRLYGP